MKLKKIMIFALILISALTIGTINAAYIYDVSTDFKDIDYFENDTALNLEGFNFTIPKGFGIVENESIDESEGNHTESVRFYSNENKDIIMVSTEPIVRHDLILSDYTPCDVDMNRHSINGHEGIEWTMDNESYFIYFDNDHLITVGATNSAFLEKIIRWINNSAFLEKIIRWINI